MAAKPQKTQRLRRNFPPFPSIPSPPSFSWPPRESSPVLCASSSPPSRWRQSRKKPNGYAAPNRRETRPFSSPLPSFSRLSFFVRHSHALPGNPVPNCEQQDWIPTFGENDGRGGMARMTPKTGFPPSVRMTAGRAMVIPRVVRVFLFPSFSWPPRESSPRPHCIVLRRHSPAPPGNPVLQWERTRLDSHLR